MEVTKYNDFFSLVTIDVYSITPKYLQFCDGVVQAVQSGHLAKGDFLPSLNELSFRFEFSRDTAEKACNHLKKLGVISSIPGKGYFVTGLEFRNIVRVCLLFNKLSLHKKIIYDAFVEALGSQAAIDFYIYNNDFNVFKKLITEKNRGYSHYVMIPHFVDGEEFAAKVINTIPKDKLVLLDKQVSGVGGDYAAVYEDFQGDIYWALTEVIGQLQKYHTIKVVFPPQSYYPLEILKGIRLFCGQYAFEYVLVNALEAEPINIGDLFICVSEEDLVPLLEKIMDEGLLLGKDVGLISYNETPLKKLMLNGLTTVSTNFAKMGRMAADMILNKKIEQVKVPFSIVLRNSL